MNEFDFENYVIENGFSFANHSCDYACENNNGWVIYFNNKDYIIIYCRAFEDAQLADIPKTEKEATDLFDLHGIED